MPKEWKMVTLNDICDKVTDGSHNPPKETETGLPMLSAKNIHDGIIDFQATHRLIPVEQFQTEDRRTSVTTGDILLTIVGALGRVAVVPNDFQKFTLQRSVAVLAAPQIDSNFFGLALKDSSFQSQIFDNAKGTAQKGIYLKKLRELTVMLPPLAEQKVIADKLDELLAQVESTKARLDAIPAILKSFRQSVLAAAVSGKLTEENEERNFKTLGEAGVTVKTGPFGSALHKKEYVIDGIPLINPMHINNGAIAPANHMTVTKDKFAELSSWKLEPGDIVLGRRGEMGRAAVVPEESKPMLCGTGSMVLRADRSVLPEYLCSILRSTVAINYFNKDAVGSTMVNLNQKVIKGLEVFFPPYDEQVKIVRRVEELFAFADKVEAQVNAAQTRVNNLTQSILAKAFRGELTADWRAANPELICGENSATALLERIKAEREALSVKTKPAKKAKA